MARILSSATGSMWERYSLIVVCLVALMPTLATAQSFAVRDARIFDGEDVHPAMTVVVRDGVIASVRPDTVVPPGIEVFDGTGHTLLPGLFECHGHMWGDALTQALAFGVTTVLDMFADPDWAAERRSEQREGLAAARADLLSAGLLVTAPGGHGTQFGLDIPTITTPMEAAGAVRGRLEQGSDYIKIVYQPCEGCSPSIDWATMGAVISEAHAHGVKAVVHVHTLEFGRDAISAGADGLVHLFADRVANAEFLKMIVDAGAFVVPTLSVTASLGGRRDAGDLLAHPAFWQYLSAEDIKNAIASNPRASSSRWFQWDSVAVTLKLLVEHGVPILAGSDPPNIGTAWGASMHRELELMVAAGMSPIAALRSATSIPAQITGLTDRGRIAPGLRADLLLVEGDPTHEIRATRNIAAIWKQGIRFDREAYRVGIDAAVDR
jgi:imidazolonepropionase-like amidohydrolase